MGQNTRHGFVEREEQQQSVGGLADDGELLDQVVAQLGALTAHAFTHARDGTPLRDAPIDQLDGAEPVDAERPLSCVERPDLEVSTDWMPRLRESMTAVTA